MTIALNLLRRQRLVFGAETAVPVLPCLVAVSPDWGGPWQPYVHLPDALVVPGLQPAPCGQQVPQHRHSGVQAYPVLFQVLVLVQQPRTLGAAEPSLHCGARLEPAFPFGTCPVDWSHFSQKLAFRLLGKVEIAVAGAAHLVLQMTSTGGAAEPVAPVFLGPHVVHDLAADADGNATFIVDSLVKTFQGLGVLPRRGLAIIGTIL